MGVTYTYINPEKEFTVEEVLSTIEPKIEKTKITFDIEKLLLAKLGHEDATIPTLDFTQDAYRKMIALVKNFDKEIAWHGVVQRDGYNFKVTDILVYPQIVSGTTVDSDDEKYANWFAGLDDDTFNGIRLQGHSHVNMGVTPSGVDEKYYTELIASVSDYYFVIIVNKSEAFTLRMYDKARNLRWDGLQPTVEGMGVTSQEWAKEQIDKYISSKTYAPIQQGLYPSFNPTPYGKDVKPVKKQKDEMYILKNLTTGRIRTTKIQPEKTQLSEVVIGYTTSFTEDSLTDAQFVPISFLIDGPKEALEPFVKEGTILMVYEEEYIPECTKAVLRKTPMNLVTSLIRLCDVGQIYAETVYTVNIKTGEIVFTDAPEIGEDVPEEERFSYERTEDQVLFMPVEYVEEFLPITYMTDEMAKAL